MNKNGFTLVEISIVLVIVGLLIGGVLVGQSLIESAKINKTISEIRQYEIAFRQFKTKFKYFPGDVPTNYGFSAVSRWCGGGNTACAADGIINTSYGTMGVSDLYVCNVGNSEIAASWLHLTEAKFLSKPFGGCVSNQQVIGTTLPKLTLGGGLGVYGLTDGNHYFITSAERSTGNEGVGMKGTDAFTVQQTYAFDNKMDDGMPNTGRAHNRAQGGDWAQNAWWLLSASGCTSSTATTDPYNLTSTYKCSLRIAFDKI